MNRNRVLVAALAATSLILASCGGDDEAATDEGDGASDEPVKLALLWEVAGESPDAVDDYERGAQMAIDEINAAGGIDGRQIEAERFPASTDPQKSTAAYLEALDTDPSAIIGYPVESQIEAAASNIERGQVPFIGVTSAGDKLRFGAEAGSEWTWIMEYGGSIVDTMVRHMTDELGLSEIGLMGINFPYGTAAIEAGEAALAERDLEPADVSTHELTATDLTQQVIAAKDAEVDGVIDATFPNHLAVQLKQFEQNGLDVPTFSGGSGPVVVNNGLATGKAIDDFYAVVACDPSGTEDADLRDFTTRFAERYPDAGAPTYISAFAYDAIHIVKAAIEEAGSTDPAAINEALGQITVTDGVVCGAEYQADGSHFLNHQSVVIDYSADGTGKTSEVYETRMLDKAE